MEGVWRELELDWTAYDGNILRLCVLRLATYDTDNGDAAPVNGGTINQLLISGMPTNVDSEEKKKLQQHIQDLEEQLEEEEAARQKLQIEKVQVEAKMKQLEEQVIASDDYKDKFGKEKKGLEEKLSDVSATLAEEEEKAKHLLKLKAKHESTIGELEDKMRKEATQKQELERSKRKDETELGDMKDTILKIVGQFESTVHEEVYIYKKEIEEEVSEIWPKKYLVFT